MEGSEGLKKLKEAMKRHVYKNKFGNDAIKDAHLWMDSYNPLTI
jgi:hypothetical protein